MSTINAGRNLLPDTYCLDVPPSCCLEERIQKAFRQWKGEQFK